MRKSRMKILRKSFKQALVCTINTLLRWFMSFGYNRDIVFYCILMWASYNSACSDFYSPNPMRLAAPDPTLRMPLMFQVDWWRSEASWTNNCSSCRREAIQREARMKQTFTTCHNVKTGSPWASCFYFYFDFLVACFPFICMSSATIMLIFASILKES